MTIISSSELSSHTEAYIELAEKEHVFVERNGKFFRITLIRTVPMRPARKPAANFTSFNESTSDPYQ
jgi:hypothetical protein